MNFGITSASEIFQETIRNVIAGIPGARNISDDIIVFGKTERDHDIALHATLKRLSEKGLTLNKSKCEFGKDKIEFFGLVFGKNGISPDPVKVKAVQEAKPPQNVAEVRSLLGMLNYSSRFIPDYATLCEPLRRLTRKDEIWEWSQRQEEAFQKLKKSITSEPVMAYYDPDKPTEIAVDASPVGLGAILIQEGRAIAYATKLSQT